MKDLTNKRIERRKYNSTLEKEGKISGTQEFFTPEKLCNEMLDKIPPEAYENLDTTFLDSTMGNGNFLVIIYDRKLMHCKTVNDAIKALKSIYGTELMEDNTNECRNRLYLRFKEYCKNKNLTAEQFKIASEKCCDVLRHNFVCTDTFKWDYDNWCSIE